jgi:hypothetical protein
MSLPSINDFRQRVESIEPLDKRIAFQTVYQICGRIGEVITEKYPSDKTCNPTGNKLTVKKAFYKPDLNNPQERDLWTFIKLMQGHQVNYAEINQVKEEVAVFHVATEKRGGLIREIGLPLNPKYDPWTKEVFDYISKKSDNGFHYTRQEMWSTAKEAFKGLSYKFHPYKRAIIENGQYQYNEKDKLVKVQVDEKTKRFTDHGIRHLRNLFNKQFYGLTPEERAGYGGWTLATTTGTSAAQDAYEESPWRVYFPKLLKPLNQ